MRGNITQNTTQHWSLLIHVVSREYSSFYAEPTERVFVTQVQELGRVAKVVGGVQ